MIIFLYFFHLTHFRAEILLIFRCIYGKCKTALRLTDLKELKTSTSKPNILWSRICRAVERYENLEGKWFYKIFFRSKLCFETKSKKLGVGYFTSISGHFFANFINSFQKTEVLSVILIGLTCQNLIWLKSYNINHKVFHFLLFSIL